MINPGRTALTRVRWGGVAVVLASISYGAAGLLHNPDAPELVTCTVLPVLKFAIPALFLGGLAGLHCRLLLGAGSSLTSSAGFLLGYLGTTLGAIDAVGLERSYFGQTGIGGWWWALLFAGLTLTGLANTVKGGLRALGAVMLASGTLGWVSILTDPAFPGVLVPTRPVHVAFAALFCVSATVLGLVLLSGPPSLAPRQR